MDSLATCSSSALKYRTSFSYCCSTAEIQSFVSDAFLLSCGCLFIYLLTLFARDKTYCYGMRALSYVAWTMPHAALKGCSITSLFSNCMQREALMHLLFTRHMEIARYYRDLLGLWFKAQKKDRKEVTACSAGMEVVMLEKKRLQHIGSIPFWKLLPVIPIMWISRGNWAVAPDLSSKSTIVKVHTWRTDLGTNDHSRPPAKEMQFVMWDKTFT